MIVLTTMDHLPEGCYDNCPLCHDGYCLGLPVGSNPGWPYQSAQEVRPYNCPLKEYPEDNEGMTLEDE